MLLRHKGLILWTWVSVILDVNSLLVMEWKITKGNILVYPLSHDTIYSVGGLSYITEDLDYAILDIYVYAFRKTRAIPVIRLN